jgi:hypothetical protein
MKRSVMAVTAGFVTILVLAMGTDLALRALLPGRFSPSGRVDDAALLLLMQLYVFAFAAFGCWLTARLAPDRPMRHALILGVLGLAFNVAGTIATWETAPAWYHLLALALVMPAAWLGGTIRERQLARRGGTGRLAAA